MSTNDLLLLAVIRYLGLVQTFLHVWSMSTNGVEQMNYVTDICGGTVCANCHLQVEAVRRSSFPVLMDSTTASAKFYSDFQAEKDG